MLISLRGATMRHNAHEPYLFETAQGHVLRCMCCGRIQIVFRGLTLLVDEQEFRIVERTVARAYEELEDRPDEGFCLLTASDAGEVSTTLRRQEVAALHRLLMGARAMLVLDRRLRDVEVGVPAHALTEWAFSGATPTQ